MIGRPFNEYQQLWNIGKNEIHKPEFYQKADECGCMVVLRYWNLFINKPYDLRGKTARKQVLKYYMGSHNMLVESSRSSCGGMHKDKNQWPHYKFSPRLVKCAVL